jgi:phage-related protein
MYVNTNIKRQLFCQWKEKIKNLHPTSLLDEEQPMEPVQTTKALRYQHSPWFSMRERITSSKKQQQQQQQQQQQTWAMTPPAIVANAKRTRRGEARHTDARPPRRATPNIVSVVATVVNA